MKCYNFLVNFERVEDIVKRDQLVIPNDFDNEIINFVINYIKEIGIIDLSFVSKSTYSVEFAKSMKTLDRYFDTSVLERVNDIFDKIQIIGVSNYSCRFNTLDRTPDTLFIKSEANILSHVSLGHEIIHLLKESSFSEYKNFLRYSEVLPILYEFIQTKYKSKNMKNNIFISRLNRLSNTYNNLYNSSKEISQFFESHPDKYEYYKMPGNVYFISFYYALILYSIYKNEPKEVLFQMRNVLLHEMTTEELLKYFGLDEKIDKSNFEFQYNLILQKNNLK